MISVDRETFVAVFVDGSLTMLNGAPVFLLLGLAGLTLSSVRKVKQFAEGFALWCTLLCATECSMYGYPSRLSRMNEVHIRLITNVLSPSSQECIAWISRKASLLMAIKRLVLDRLWNPSQG